MQKGKNSPKVNGNILARNKVKTKTNLLKNSTKDSLLNNSNTIHSDKNHNAYAGTQYAKERGALKWLMLRCKQIFSFII